MTIIYALMLFFVFVTLVAIAKVFLNKHSNESELLDDLFAIIWAGLGTFFFHSVW